MKFLGLFLLLNVFVLDTSCALNEPCAIDDDCTAQEKRQCDELSKYSEGQQKCLNYATEYNTLCYEDWQCKDFIGNNSQCLNNACLCATGYRWYQGKCQKYANKGEACDSDVICLDLSNPLALNCTDNICQCNEGYYDRGEDCRNKSSLDNECAITADCFPTKDMFHVWTYSHCELGKCILNAVSNKPKSKEFNNTFTYSKPSSVLNEFMDKVIEESSTESNNTKCPNGVSPDLPETDCLECQNTMFFKNTTCICQPGFFLMDSRCIAELGMPSPNIGYESDKECPIKPGKKVDNACYCKNYWFQDSTNRECKKTTLEYTRNCLDNDWCKAMGPYAYCNSVTEKCECSSQAILNETSFYCHLKPDADISNICFENSACPLYETCTDEKCQCDDGFFRVNSTSLCLPEIGYSCEVRDCSHIENAECSSNDTCQCKSEEFVSNGFMCLETVHKLYDECKIQQQCKNIPHTDCIKVSSSENATSQCRCTDGFLDVSGVCYAVKSPGSQCSTQFNCTIILGDTFECRNNLCQCPIGTNLNTDNTCGTSSSNRLYLHSTMSVLLSVFAFFRWKSE